MQVPPTQPPPPGPNSHCQRKYHLKGSDKKKGEHIQLYYTIRNSSRLSTDRYTSHHSKPAAVQYTAEHCKTHNVANQ
ncbi:uncharacterized protein N7479_003332 [Penicillium vulpinum]|uniref:uncharacterized protein n=1 Tax=Penicillium vulpinum TaxID=29845 RepID=UPI00254933AB|nr:uncharacterized protein N7479_003332 [Penicillium vulpinum]KAJ5963456.1 hypothetical protein N7479_003332 [Penicillium vulpinum]